MKAHRPAQRSFVPGLYDLSALRLPPIDLARGEILVGDAYMRIAST